MYHYTYFCSIIEKIECLQISKYEVKNYLGSKILYSVDPPIKTAPKHSPMGPPGPGRYH